MTILYFPKLQEDELFYSWVARYGKHTGCYGPKALLEELFGDRNSSAVMDFPIHLEVFVECLSQIKPRLNVVELIEQTALWPYYRPFLPESRAAALVNSMKSGHGNDIHTRLGLAAGRVSEADYVKVCPQCLKYQIETAGEPYIQRLFQLPSVWVCPEHECHLVYSALPFRPKNKHAFTPLSEVMSGPLHQTGFEDFDFGKLLTLTLDSQELLQGSFPAHELSFWQPMYYGLLPVSCRKGRVSVDQKALSCQVQHFWGKALLQKIGAGLEVEHDSWLQKMTRKHRSAFHPLLHLLVFRALQEKACLQTLCQVTVVKSSTPISRTGTNPMMTLDEVELEPDRSEWKALLDENSQASVTQLRRKSPALYTRLYRRDQHWLIAHSPKMVRKGNNSENRVDWKVRDFRLARASLRLIRAFLLADVNRRVSGTFVLKELSMASVFEKNKKCFPLTERVFKKHSESVEGYQIRRIDRVVARFKAEGDILKEWKIFREARLRDNISTQVQRHLQACLEGV